MNSLRPFIEQNSSVLSKVFLGANGGLTVVANMGYTWEGIKKTIKFLNLNKKATAAGTGTNTVACASLTFQKSYEIARSLYAWAKDERKISRRSFVGRFLAAGKDKEKGTDTYKVISPLWLAFNNTFACVGLTLEGTTHERKQLSVAAMRALAMLGSSLMANLNEKELARVLNGEPIDLPEPVLFALRQVNRMVGNIVDEYPKATPFVGAGCLTLPHISKMAVDFSNTGKFPTSSACATAGYLFYMAYLTLPQKKNAPEPVSAPAPGVHSS